jgi:hypothetical protein
MNTPKMERALRAPSPKKFWIPSEEGSEGLGARGAEDGCKPSPPGFVYAWGRCHLFRFGFHSLPFIVINKKDRSKVII